MTRHAFYESSWREKQLTVEHALVLELVEEVRMDLPKCGTRKLYNEIKPKLLKSKIKIGRDLLFDLLRNRKLLVRRRKCRKPITTNSNHVLKRYPNLVREFIPTAADQLWVSDITYIELKDRFCYLSLITDAYSRRIVGYHLHHNLAAEGCIEALHIAISNRVKRTMALIHHSDRGIQYCSTEYLQILLANGISISMTENGDPYENAMAERVNGILKDELGLNDVFVSVEQAKEAVARAIHLYNNRRPHASCDYLTPDNAHHHEGVLPKRWKKYPMRKTETEQHT